MAPVAFGAVFFLPASAPPQAQKPPRRIRRLSLPPVAEHLGQRGNDPSPRSLHTRSDQVSRTAELRKALHELEKEQVL
ncbi:hypothetical protein GQ53DRAFT_747745 [Thozetella sp. PMI_491]|nr:hypothetical protein GQ53DRAFT_747745 [Thozetella sp. PMI_491]